MGARDREALEHAVRSALAWSLFVAIGFFGLFIDNLLQLMVIAVLCEAVCGMDAAFVTRTILPGASPEIIDSSVTNVVETSVNSIPGIEHIDSTSAPGVSVVVVRFTLEKDVDVAFNEVQAKVNQVLQELPRETRPPVVAKVEFHPGELFPRVGFIVTNRSLPNERVLAFYNQRGIAEQQRCRLRRIGVGELWVETTDHHGAHHQADRYPEKRCQGVAADHHHGSVRDVGDRLLGVCDGLVDHEAALSCRASASWCRSAWRSAASSSASPGAGG